VHTKANKILTGFSKKSYCRIANEGSFQLISNDIYCTAPFDFSAIPINLLLYYLSSSYESDYLLLFDCLSYICSSVYLLSNVVMVEPIEGVAFNWLDSDS